MGDNKKITKKSKKSSKKGSGSRKKKSVENILSDHPEDAHTPPLPTNQINSSIEYLIKRRESLKMALIKIDKSSNDPQKRINTNKKENLKLDSYRKRSIEEEDTESKKPRAVNKRNSTFDTVHQSPIDSEDEDDIIERRRKQRQQLLAKLSTSRSKKGDGEHCALQESHSISSSGQPSKHSSHSNKEKIVEKNSPQRETTDMFAEQDDTVPTKITSDDDDSYQNDDAKARRMLLIKDDLDDAEGYLNIRIGEVLDSRYVIKSVLGQGMFANVIKAQDKQLGNTEVAVKIARNSDLMYRNGLKEINMLREIDEADPEHLHHCVKMFRNFVHKGHLCIVLESLSMDLRSVLRKYGRHGLNLKAVSNYSRQLLSALKLLKKIGIIHADVKPDNILVNEKKNILKLCDFGSAEKLDNISPRQYLVSRFYRAPEIILGIPYGHAVDVWSAGCTMYELATGRIMFTGNSNNKMLKCFMDVKGRIPNKLIRRGKFKDQHFNYNNNFLFHKKDANGVDKVTEVSQIVATRNILQELKKYCTNLTPSEEKKLTQLKDLLEKMLILDPIHRLTAADCIKNSFILDGQN